MESFWQWWQESFGLRIGAGAGIFALLLAVDLVRRGWGSRRLREYGFLLLCVAGAVGYGVINDQITVTISWEYFYYGKGVGESVGYERPDAVAMRWQAARVGAEATWAGGLLVGVALLMANNPRPKRDDASTRPVGPPLPFARLARLMLWVLLAAAAGGAVLGLVGWLGGLTWVSRDFADMAAADQWRPRRFLAVWGIHLGGYLGGLAGTAATVWHILRKRRAGA